MTFLRLVHLGIHASQSLNVMWPKSFIHMPRLLERFPLGKWCLTVVTEHCIRVFLFFCMAVHSHKIDWVHEQYSYLFEEYLAVFYYCRESVRFQLSR